jgi:hypothetical protein
MEKSKQLAIEIFILCNSLNEHVNCEILEYAKKLSVLEEHNPIEAEKQAGLQQLFY